MAEKSFGRYRLIGLLGQGGMGQVYRAYDTATDRVVALKVLPPNLVEDQTFQQRFRREAQTAASLNDPHVVPIHSFGEIDGRLYVDMRLIEGRDLEAVLTEGGPMEPARAVRIIEQVAEALDAAHSVDLVHRDIKPPNILLARRDFVYLIDFGIARALGATRYTSTGAAIGTLAYMAPERFDAEEVGPLADVYALACVLHECLTGSQPFPGTSMEKQIAGHLTKPPPRPSAIQTGVPPTFDEVIAKGMAKDPRERLQSAMALADAAREALDDRASPPPPPAQPTVTEVNPTQQAPARHPPPVRAPAQPPTPPAYAPAPFFSAPTKPSDTPARTARGETEPTQESTGSNRLRLAGLLLVAAVFVGVLVPATAWFGSEPWLSIVPNYWIRYSIVVVVGLGLSYLFASAAFGLMALHLRSRRSHIATVAAAWIASAAFAALAVACLLMQTGMYTIPLWIALAVSVVLLLFGITALITTRQLWMLWAAAAGLCGIVACIYDLATSGSVIDRFIISAWFALLLVFAFYVYLSGRKESPQAGSLPGLLVMAFAILIILGWMMRLPGALRYYPVGFFRRFDPYAYLDNTDVFGAEVLVLALAFAFLGSSLRTRRNIVVVVVAWLLSGVLLFFVFDQSRPAIEMFVLLTIFGVAAAILTRRSWALYAGAAGLLGAIMWQAARDVDSILLGIFFVAWCALFFMFGISLYRSREDTSEPAGTLPIAQRNDHVDNWAPTVHRRQW